MIVQIAVVLNHEYFRGTPESLEMQHQFYRTLYPAIQKEIEALEINWRDGTPVMKKINCLSEQSKGAGFFPLVFFRRRLFLMF